MAKTKGFTLKQRKWRKELMRCLSPTHAAMLVYDCKDTKSAAVIACENLKKLNISMSDLMDKMGLTDEEDVKDLIRLRKAQKLHVCDVYIKDDNDKFKINKNSNDFIEVDDNQTQLKALELTARLKGNLKDKPLVDQSTHYHIFYENIIKKAGLNGLPKSVASRAEGAEKPS